jgi:hypothetical protein
MTTLKTTDETIANAPDKLVKLPVPYKTVNTIIKNIDDANPDATHLILFPM